MAHRNVATLVGNIMTGSPISDLNPILMAAGIKLEVIGPKAKRFVEMNSNFFTSYRNNVIEEEEVVVSFFLPYTNPNQYVKAYKQSKRKDDDIAIVNMAINLVLCDFSKEIRRVSVAFGGVAATTIMPIDRHLPAKRKYEWDNDFLEAAISHLSYYFNKNLKFDAPGGEVDYRKTLVLSLFYQTYLTILFEIRGEILPRELTNAQPCQATIPQSAQLFEKPDEAQPRHDTIGRPELTLSAFHCTSGEAVYTDDIPYFENELHVALLFSKKAHAKIRNIDANKALSLEGVEAFYCAKDLTTEKNKYCLVMDDERVFKDHLVECNGQVLGAIVAGNKKLAQEAIELVNVEYEELDAVITLEEAIEKNSFYPNYPIKLQNGNITKVEEEAGMCLEGVFKTGKQEHFYIEPHSVIVVPKVRAKYFRNKF